MFQWRARTKICFNLSNLLDDDKIKYMVDKFNKFEMVNYEKQRQF